MNHSSQLDPPLPSAVLLYHGTERESQKTYRHFQIRETATYEVIMILNLWLGYFSLESNSIEQGHAGSLSMGGPGVSHQFNFWDLWQNSSAKKNIKIEICMTTL